MVVGGFDWSIFAFVLELFKLGQIAALSVWQRLVDLQAAYPQIISVQSGVGVFGTAFAVWRWWEAREANLFARFEAMIERSEDRLVKARNDLLDVMIRPGPGILIRAPVFVEVTLRRVLRRRRWTTPFSRLRPAEAITGDLAKAITTCDHKIRAHLLRLSLFREQVASARLIMGALAAGRAQHAREMHEWQRLDQQALDCYRAVLAIPEHENDPAALELIAHQLRRLDGASQSTISSYELVVATLREFAPSLARNRCLARAKRDLALLRYPVSPVNALTLLVDASALLTALGPPRDRDLLEYADNLYFESIARLRLNQNIQGPQKLVLAQASYVQLLNSLRTRRWGLFAWMRRDHRFSGHRVKEMRLKAERGLKLAQHLIAMNNRHQQLLIFSLAAGAGVPRRNRTL